ncbi:MAG: YggS family pyridoxal phosphate-dependent enzyme [Chthoniobacteraceae bacterium]
MTESGDRLAQVRATIAAAAIRAGRDPSEIELVAASKAQPPEAVAEVLEAGHALFGESRVQEARAKIPLLPSRARWHFIGHLQKNKIRAAFPLFELFHGIDSVAVASEMNRLAAEAGAFPRLLLEVNLAAESSKFGFTPDSLLREFDTLLGFDRIAIDGLMALPPPAPTAEGSRKYFVQLRETRDRLSRTLGIPLPHLSMGMSTDYQVAIEEGATLVRIGTAIFGERRAKSWKPTASFDDT